MLARVGEPARELADGRGLAGAVDADDQQHEGLVRDRSSSGCCDGSRMAVIASVQRRDQRVDVVEFLARDLAAQFLEDVLRGLDADVGGQQARLELVEDFGIDLSTGHEVGEIVGQPRSRRLIFARMRAMNDCGLSSGKRTGSGNEKGGPNAGLPLRSRK